MFPEPLPGQVIRYCYLWRSDHLSGKEEGQKDRPCAIVLAAANERGKKIVIVLPITHFPPSPSNAHFAIEIPQVTKRRLGLDDARSWVVLTEANRFVWPGPDLRFAQNGDAKTLLYGELPRQFYRKIRDAFEAAYKAKMTRIVQRTE